MKRLVALAIFFTALTASAHDLGVSRATLVERENGSFHGRFTFAAREAPAALDRDGHVAIDVRTDGAPCTAGPAATTTEGDGVIVEEDFACTRATAKIEVTANFVSSMTAHEDVMRIETPESVHEELLNASHRTMSLELQRSRAAPRSSNVIIVIAAIVVALTAMAIRYKLRR